MPGQSFKLSEDAASLGNCGDCPRSVNRRRPQDEGEAPSAVAMEEDAIRPVSDAERPSLFAPTKMARSLLGPGTSFERDPWEVFLAAQRETWSDPPHRLADEGLRKGRTHLTGQVGLEPTRHHTPAGKMLGEVREGVRPPSPGPSSWKQ